MDIHAKLCLTVYNCLSAFALYKQIFELGKWSVLIECPYYREFEEQPPFVKVTAIGTAKQLKVDDCEDQDTIFVKTSDGCFELQLLNLDVQLMLLKNVVCCENNM